MSETSKVLSFAVPPVVKAVTVREPVGLRQHIQSPPELDDLSAFFPP